MRINWPQMTELKYFLIFTAPVLFTIIESHFTDQKLIDSNAPNVRKHFRSSKSCERISWPNMVAIWNRSDAKSATRVSRERNRWRLIAARFTVKVIPCLVASVRSPSTIGTTSKNIWSGIKTSKKWTEICLF